MKKNIQYPENRKEIFITPITFGVIFVFHFLLFLAFYPGLCTYDLNEQIEQWTSGKFIANHPLIHTFFIGSFYDLFEDHNKGYACATIIQLLVVDGAMTYVMWYIRKHVGGIKLYIVSLIFYALFPINSILAVSHTKDILFAAFGVIFTLDCMRLVSDEETIGSNVIFIIRMLINMVLMVLLRNNALHALALMIIVLMVTILYKKIKKNRIDKYIIRLFAICMLGLIISFAGNRMLIKCVNGSLGSVKEMMSLPTQIMGRVYNTVASEHEKNIITKYIPNPHEYTYYISDPMKRELPFEIWESKCKYFLLDTTLIALNHPIESMKAVWFNIQGYFDIFHCPYSSEHFFLARSDYRGGATQESKLTLLRDAYVSLFNKTDIYGNNPIVIFFNIGIYIWVMIIAVVKLFITKDRKKVIPYLFMLTYLITLLAGPAAIIRYAYIYILTLPLSALCLRANK